MPQRFGRYVLLDCMGHGGMAEVFRAVVPGVEGFRRELVVKRILAERASSPTFIEMFVHEARISALLHHPNIVQVFDFGQVDGSYFLAMEMLRGRDLHGTMRALRDNGQKFPIPIAVHIAHEIAAGLSYAHTLKAEGQPLGIVHRDVSPSNIMCLRAGGVKLLDFGVASALGETGTEEDERRAFRGKVSYAAPEYVLGHGQDARIDLFALGVTLWEMLVGKRLFHGQSDEEKLSSLLEQPILPPSARRPAISEALDRIVMRALEREPERRYQTAADMMQDLEGVVLDVKYQPHMLPQLLEGLFGAEVSPPPVAGEVERLLQLGSPEPAAAGVGPRFSSARKYTATLVVAATVAVLAGAGLAALLPRSNAAHPAWQAPSTRPEVLPLAARLTEPPATPPPSPAAARTGEESRAAGRELGAIAPAGAFLPAADSSVSAGALPAASQPSTGAAHERSSGGAAVSTEPSARRASASTRSTRRSRASSGRGRAAAPGGALKAKSFDPFAELTARGGKRK